MEAKRNEMEEKVQEAALIAGTFRDKWTEARELLDGVEIFDYRGGKRTGVKAPTDHLLKIREWQSRSSN